MQIITRVEAKKLGLVRYYTGKPCINGHIAERYVKRWVCVKCCVHPQGGIDRSNWKRRHRAKKGGFAPPPNEQDCPPIPVDSHCQCCGKLKKLTLDHCHVNR